MKHALTHIHPDAKIGENVVIDPFVTIQGDVEIGDGCWIGSNVVIHDGARIGKNAKIFPGAVISTIPQDLKFHGEYSIVEIGDDTTIREFATVNRGTDASGKTTLGKNVLIMAYSHVAHDCVIKDHAILANAVNLAGHVTIEEYAVIGGMCAIHQFLVIGKHSILAGGSLVGKDVPPYSKAGRYPITFSGVNSVGLQRRGFSAEVIEDIREIYRVIFQSGLNISQALDHIEANFADTEYRNEIVHFIRNSENGIMKGYFTPKEANAE